MSRDDKYKTIEMKCKTCDKVFYITRSDFCRGRGKFCGASCSRQGALNCNPFFLQKPSSEMAWVLGLLFSDGHLAESKKGKRARVSLKSIDYQLLETVQKIAENDSKIYFCGKTDAGNDIFRIDWSHPQIIKDAISWGLHPRKTFTTTYPVNLPIEFAPDFIRGLFDGDGHVSCGRVKNKGKSYYRSFSMLGTINILNSIAEYLPVIATIKPYGKIAKLSLYNREDFLKIYQYLYYNESVSCLIRKKQAFIDTLSAGINENVEVIGFNRFNGINQSIEPYQRKKVFYGKRSAENRKNKKK